MDIKELADRIAIRETLATISRGVDRVDGELIAGCYTADSIDHHGPFTGSGREFADRPWRSSPANVRSHHMLGQSIIDVLDDEARSETYFSAHDIYDHDDGRRVVREYFGRYLDVLHRTDGGWKVRTRRTVLEWGHERPANDLWIGAREYPRGRRAPNDPVYEWE